MHLLPTFNGRAPHLKVNGRSPTHQEVADEDDEDWESLIDSDQKLHSLIGNKGSLFPKVSKTELLRALDAASGKHKVGRSLSPNGDFTLLMILKDWKWQDKKRQSFKLRLEYETFQILQSHRSCG